ncbi:hypothetical protein M422DRAFT_63632 [Sphaerobolus stellatus SS14]|nr:hypothetical protein M422DRAFT_63632 [Sphaerobolus stellatus SS14]
MEPIPPAYGLPQYSASVETPDYTIEPGLAEARLQINDRIPRVDTGTFVTGNKFVTLTLNTKPSYGKGATIQGKLTFPKTDGIISVIVKLRGEFEIALSTPTQTRSAESDRILDEHAILYSSDQQTSKWKAFSKRSNSQSQSPTSPVSPGMFPDKCPATLTFAILIPTVYSRKEVTEALPPSYTGFNGDNVSELKIDIKYSLKVIVIKSSLVDRNYKILIPMEYRPRSCPAQPSLQPSLTLLPTLSSLPEEWKLFEVEISTRISNAGLPNILGKLYLPRTQVYAMWDSIPFFLRLSSLSKNLLKSFESITSLEEPSPDKSKRLRSHWEQYPTVRDPIAKRSGLPITLCVERHVSVEFQGHWLQFKECLSKTVLRSRPVKSSDDPNTGGSLTHIDWKGQLEIPERNRCSAFSALGIRLRVNDFICLNIEAPNAQFQNVRQMIPIRLTTDCYSERLLPGMEHALGFLDESPVLTTL